jgi:Bacterial SH3 domain
VRTRGGHHATQERLFWFQKTAVGRPLRDNEKARIEFHLCRVVSRGRSSNRSPVRQNATTPPHACAQSRCLDIFFSELVDFDRRPAFRLEIPSSERRVTMNTEGDPRGPASVSGEAERKAEDRSATPATRHKSTTRMVLGGVVVLLLLGAATYYFVEHREGTEVAMRPASESPSAATPAPPPETGVSPAPSATPAPPAEPTPPQQSAATAPPNTSSAQEPQAAPSEATAPAPKPQPSPPAPAVTEATNVPAPQEAKPPADSVAAAPKTEPETAAAPAPPQPSLQDQPAALPDQKTATPKTETVLVVMRGPANIRSAPGKGGRVIGTAAKNATVKELSRSGKWVQVETESGTGWIAAGLLGPQPSASR